MTTPPLQLPTPRPAGLELGPELEAALHAVEERLAALGGALCERDLVAIDRAAADLHRALAAALQRFALAARQGGVPIDLRRRLALASGQVAAQRESLARATAALDRAIDLLMPGISTSPVYGAGGAPSRPMGLSNPV